MNVAVHQAGADDALQLVKSARSQALLLAKDIQLDSLADLLNQKSAEHAKLQQELDASNVALTALLQQSRQTLGQLQQRAQSARHGYESLYADVTDFHDEVYSPISRSHGQQPRHGGSATNASQVAAPSRTLFETLQANQTRIKSLTSVRDLLAHLAKAEELALVAKEQTKLPTPAPSIETYLELVEQVHLVSGVSATTKAGRVDPSLRSAAFVTELAHVTLRDLGKALEAKLVKTLEALGWPGKKIHQDGLDYANNEKAKAFKGAFLDICNLEKAAREHPLPRDYSNTDAKAASSLAVQALAAPLILRFRYHFDGKRQTNRLDKPEWYFAHIANALTEHAPFIKHDVQRMLNQASVIRDGQKLDAMQEFITALLHPLARKVRASVPQLIEMPSLLAHTLYQALQFDQDLRDRYAYYPPQDAAGNDKVGDWQGIANLILGNKAWLEGWKESERKFVDDKFFEIISAPEAWHISEDYSPSTSNTWRPTNSALKVRDLFDQVTDRYRPLPSPAHQILFFADIQLPLLDGYLQRITSATDAFENLSFGLMRAVPGTLTGAEGTSARLTNGLNGLQRLVRALVSASWMENVCKEWEEDIFFLEFWQEVQRAASQDANVRQKCKLVLDYVHSKAARSDTSGADSTSMFAYFIHGFSRLRERILELITRHVAREITQELKNYLGNRWDEPTFPEAPRISGAEEAESSTAGPSELSPDLISAITVFSALLSLLADALPTLPLNRLYRHAMSQVQELLIARVVFPKVWSEGGGRQFRYDVEKGWLATARDASKTKIRKPETGLRRLLDAALLVSLPSSTSGHQGNHIGQLAVSPGSNALEGVMPVSRVIQITWDDTSDAPFNEMLMKLGVKELTSRKDVKAILRKRPECWR